MTQQPFNTAALRGAVDLSAFRRPAQGGQQPAQGAGPGAPGGQAAAAPGAAGAAGADDGTVVVATDQTFNQIVTDTLKVPAVLVLWAEQMPDSGTYVDTLASLARSYEGRFRVISVEMNANPGVVQALAPLLQQAFGQLSQLPAVVGLLSGQPAPFFLGPQPEDQVRPLLDQFLQAAVANGVTGRVEVSGTPDEGADEGVDEAAEEQLPPLHQEAYDAIDRGDLDAAVTAYEQALEQDPADEDARLGLGQVQLLRRTQDLDVDATRTAAADNPKDVAAQINAADLELVGGHVEDAFLRLVDTVRVTAGDDRNAAREHLLSLFEVVGAQDPRVTKARQSLMSALF